MISARMVSSMPSGSVLGDGAICEMKNKTNPDKYGNIAGSESS
jgi:hypothetical protein